MGNSTGAGEESFLDILHICITIRENRAKYTDGVVNYADAAKSIMGLYPSTLEQNIRRYYDDPNMTPAVLRTMWFATSDQSVKTYILLKGFGGE